MGIGLVLSCIFTKGRGVIEFTQFSVFWVCAVIIAYRPCVVLNMSQFYLYNREYSSILAIATVYHGMTAKGTDGEDGFILIFSHP